MSVSKTASPFVVKTLSPLAAAMALALTLPVTAYSKTFVVDTTVDDEEDKKTSLNEVIAEIEAKESAGTHTITFDSKLSGKSISMQQFDIYDGKITVDGSGAEDLTLVVLEGGTTYGFKSERSELAINDVNMLIEGSYGSYPTAIYFDYSSLKLTNVNITVSKDHDTESGGTWAILGAYSDKDNRSMLTLDNVHIQGNADNDSDFQGIGLWTTDVSISNSSISQMHDYYSLAFWGQNYGDNFENPEWDVTISNSVFSENQNNRVLGLYLPYDSNIKARIDGVAFDNNAVSYSVLNVASGSDGQAHDLSKEVTITNSTFSNNRSEWQVLNVYDYYNYSNEYDSTLVVNLANVTVANNRTEGSAINLYAYANEAYAGKNTVKLNIIHTTVSGNGPTPEWDSTDPSVNLELYSNSKQSGVVIVNSIIANNAQSVWVEESVLVAIDSDIFSAKNISVNNSLIGVEYIPEDAKSTLKGDNNLIEVDPMLAPLADNGGSTLTVNLLAGSPAIDSGDSSLTSDWDLFSDQRGQDRVIGDAPDMGALEFCAEGKACSQESKSGGLFGSLGFEYLIAVLGLGALRRRFKA